MQNSIGDGIGTVLVQLFTIMLSLVLVMGTVSANYINDPRESIRYFRPTAIAFDDQGTAYFSNLTNIVVFAEDESIREMGRGGREPGCFNNCAGITVIGQNIFVADTNNNRIQVLDLSGDYRYSIGELGQLNRPQDVLLFGEFILVADGGNNRIQGFTPLGDVRSLGNSKPACNTTL